MAVTNAEADAVAARCYAAGKTEGEKIGAARERRRVAKAIRGAP